MTSECISVGKISPTIGVLCGTGSVTVPCVVCDGVNAVTVVKIECLYLKSFGITYDVVVVTEVVGGRVSLTCRDTCEEDEACVVAVVMAECPGGTDASANNVSVTLSIGMSEMLTKCPDSTPGANACGIPSVL